MCAIVGAIIEHIWLMHVSWII